MQDDCASHQEKGKQKSDYNGKNILQCTLIPELQIRFWLLLLLNGLWQSQWYFNITLSTSLDLGIEAA